MLLWLCQFGMVAESWFIIGDGMGFGLLRQLSRTYIDT